MAVHLVAQHPGVHALCDFHDAAQQLLTHERARGVIGVIDADELCPRHTQGAQLVEIGQITPLFFQVHHVQVCTEALGNGGELLIARHDGDDAVARLHQGVEDMVVGPGCAVGGDDLVGLERLVQPADPLAQGRGALDVAVGEAAGGKAAPEGVLVFPGEGEEFVCGHGVDTGLGDVEARALLIGVHPFLYGKGFDFHGDPPYINKKDTRISAL